MSLHREKTIVGLTGGIASGKSTALSKFADLGWSVVSADLITAEILASDENVKQKIERRWGAGIINSSGSIDKQAVARIVFKKELERIWIEGLLHPIIRSKWISFVQSCPSPKCMVELPLLFENDLQTYFTRTISIFTPVSMMLQRLQERGLTLDESNLRLQSQLSIFRKLELADFAMWGGGSNDFLFHQVRKLDLVFS